MRILVIQHDADKGLGLFVPPLAEAAQELDVQFAGHGELELAGHGAVIALPGVANPDDETLAVTATRDVLREALRQELPILGICLGAELLAEAAGGATGPCRPEWGYCEVSLAAAGRDDELLGDLPERFDVFQAHNYGCELPANAVALAHSPGGLQAFRVGDNAWGIQFHPEPTLEMLDGWTQRARPPDGGRGRRPGGHPAARAPLRARVERARRGHGPALRRRCPRNRLVA